MSPRLPSAIDTHTRFWYMIHLNIVTVQLITIAAVYHYCAIIITLLISTILVLIFLLLQLITITLPSLLYYYITNNI